MALVASITTGKPFPDGSKCEPGSVIIFAAEDDDDTVLRPRAEAAGADIDRIRSVEGEEWEDLKSGKIKNAKFTLNDLESLEYELANSDLKNIRLVVIDPLGSFIPEKGDMNGEVPMRGLLDPIKNLARKFQVAILIICHTGKAEHNLRGKRRIRQRCDY